MGCVSVTDMGYGYRRHQPRGHAWRRLRKRILDAAGWRCAECGIHSSRLELHHIVSIEDGGGDFPDNLRVLCRGCHHQIHKRGPGLGAARKEWRREIDRRLRTSTDTD